MLFISLRSFYLFHVTYTQTAVIQAGHKAEIVVISGLIFVYSVHLLDPTHFPVTSSFHDHLPFGQIKSPVLAVRC